MRRAYVVRYRLRHDDERELPVRTQNNVWDYYSNALKSRNELFTENADVVSCYVKEKHTGMSRGKVLSRE